ncbi:MAG: hypothetical protein ACI9MR_001806 [Myxococcota bacterium]|jgi:hypothetical protein
MGGRGCLLYSRLRSGDTIGSRMRRVNSSKQQMYLVGMAFAVMAMGPACGASQVSPGSGDGASGAAQRSAAGGSEVEIVWLRDRPTSPAPTIAAQAPAVRPSKPGWVNARKRPWLGDGSAGSEVLAAAQRLLGLQLGPEQSFMEMVLSMAAVERSSSTHQPMRLGVRVRPMWLISYAPESGPETFAVVEGVDARGQIHAIGVRQGADTAERFVVARESISGFTHW